MLGPHSASGQKFAEVSDASGLQGYIYIYGVFDGVSNMMMQEPSKQ